MLKNNRGKKFLTCNKKTCLKTIKEMYPEVILILGPGEHGKCCICGEEDEWCNVFFEETFSAIKRGFNGKIEKVESEGYICTENCLKEFIKEEGEAEEIPGFSKKTRCLVCGIERECKRYIFFSKS